MRRRKRTRGAWFPTIGVGLGPSTEIALPGRAFALSVFTSQISNAIAPLTFDVPFEGDFASPGADSLSDIIGSGYLLRRVVGKLFAARIAALDVAERDTGPAILFSAGLLVARANDFGSGGGVDTPIGSATAAELRDNYSPLDRDTIQEPWIWRRSWILGRSGSNFQAPGATFNPQVTNATTAAFPASTAGYGSVLDGPHIDSRVKRIVSGDNRLWLSVGATPFPLDSAVIEATLVTGYFDYRIYGSLKRTVKSSVF